MFKSLQPLKLVVFITIDRKIETFPNLLYVSNNDFISNKNQSTRYMYTWLYLKFELLFMFHKIFVKNFTKY